MLFTLRQGVQKALWRGKVAARSTLALIEGMKWVGRPRRAAKGVPYHVFLRLDGLGDFWLWLPFVASLKKAFPDKPFVLIANPLWKELAQRTNLFLDVLPVDPVLFRHKSAYRRSILSELIRQLPPPEVLWQTTYTRRIVVEDLLAWSIPTQSRIAWERDPATAEPLLLSRWIDRHLYEKLLPSSLSPLAHEWVRYQHWLHTLALDKLDLSVYVHLRDQWQTTPNGEPYIILLLGTGRSYRVPPVPLLARLLQTLQRRLGLPIYAVGTDKETAVAEALEPYLKPITYKNLCGKHSLTEAAEKVIKAFLVVGPETGLTHIAATMGVPTLLIAGGGHWGRFIPYPVQTPFPMKVLTHKMSCFGCGWHCGYQLSHQKPVPCIERLSPELAEQELLGWLDLLLGLPARPSA
ncbi:MAG: glycosyltransferase family 9 protein [Bacteroidia bacterium]|nr:glycosyltransferase family 9 protein [Bacteroidia bacterium]